MERDELQRAFDTIGQQMPQRQIVLHRGSPRGVWLAAAAVVVGVFFLVKPAPEPDFVCYIDGVRIYDRAVAEQYALETLERVNAKMERASAEITRVNEILNKHLTQ